MAINLGNIVGNTITGISSGLDTQALIEGLSAVRKKPITDLQDKVTLNNSRNTQYSNLSSLLKNLSNSLNFFRSPTGINSALSNAFELRKATLSSTTLTSSNYLNVTAAPGALVGNTNVQIGQLAKALEQRSGTFTSKTTDATNNTTGSYFTAGTFQVGSSVTRAVTGGTLTGFQLASGDYTVTGSGSGIVSGGIQNITVTGGSGGQTGLEGKISGISANYNSGNVTLVFSKNGVVYTSGPIAANSAIGADTGITSGTAITFTADNGGPNQTSFQVTTTSDFVINGSSANATAFATAINSGLSNQSIYQARRISNFDNANVKAPLTGLTNADITFYSNSFDPASGGFGNISDFIVEESTGSNGSISVTIGGETFRATGLGTTVTGNVVLQSTTSGKQLRINLGANVVNLSTANQAQSLQRAFDYAFGTRELVDLTVNAGDTLTDVIFNINQKTAQTGMAASILQVSEFDYRFNLKANSEGLNGQYEIFDTSNVLTNVSLSTTQSAQNSLVRVDGVEIERSTNTITDAISNVTLNLLAVTPNYGGGTPDTISIATANDVDSVVNGIISILDNYNALRVFSAEQNERGQNGLFTENAILGKDQTLNALMSQLSEEIGRIVDGVTSANFDSLTDIGITLTDFVGDSETIATNNILTYDENKLRAAITSNFSEVREIFEFKSTTTSNSLTVTNRGNDFSLSSFKLQIDINQPVGQQVQLLDVNGAPILSGGQPIYLQAEGTRIVGPAGTPVAGLEFLYTGDGTDTIEVNITQGVADRLYNLSQNYTKADGLIDIAVKSNTEKNQDYDTEISDLETRLEDYINRLRAQFSALEQAISSVNNILLLLEANTNARNASGN